MFIIFIPNKKYNINFNVRIEFALPYETVKQNISKNHFVSILFDAYLEFTSFLIFLIRHACC
jgi:hypothetical protein